MNGETLEASGGPARTVRKGSLRDRLEILACSFVIFFTLVDNDVFLVSSVTIRGILYKLCMAASFVLLGALVASRLKRVVSVALLDLAPWLFMALVLASALWADDPLAVGQAFLGLVVSTLFGIYLACRFTVREQLTILAWILAFTIMLDLVACVAIPSIGVAPPEDGIGWKGVHEHKNQMGRVMTLGLVTLLCLSGKRFRPVAWLLCLIAGVLLIKSNSAGAIYCVTCPLMGLFLTRHLKSLPKFLQVPFFSSAILVAMLALVACLFNFGALMSLMGKDETLTGRTMVWEIAEHYVTPNLWFGHGYSVIWTGWDKGIETSPGFFSPNAHSGVVEFVLQLGLVGLVLVGILYLRALRRVFSWLMADNRLEVMWLVLLTADLFLSNLLESIPPGYTYGWILFVMACTNVTLHRRHARSYRPVASGHMHSPTAAA